MIDFFLYLFYLRMMRRRRHNLPLFSDCLPARAVHTQPANPIAPADLARRMARLMLIGLGDENKKTPPRPAIVREALLPWIGVAPLPPTRLFNRAYSKR
ncbi:MAG: hypothetical protein P8Y71_28440 [Pseudolabrys sp.]